MSLYAWPSTLLPLPSPDFSNKIQTSVIRTKMDSGRVRQRKRFTRANRLISAAWKLNDDEYALFQGVYQYKINSGADWFTISLPLGAGFKTYTVRFAEDTLNAAYEESMHWKVTAGLEVETGSPLTEAEVDALLSP